MRLFTVDDRVVNDELADGGGDAAFDAVRLCVLVVVVVGGFGFNSPSGMTSNFSLDEQLNKTKTIQQFFNELKSNELLLVIHHVRII